MTRPRAILHVINTAETGGGGEHLLHLTQALRPLGFESVVAVGRDGPAVARLREAGVRVLVLGALGLDAPRKVAGAAERVLHDVLHLHGSRSGLAGALASRLWPMRPIVYTAHAFSFHRAAAAPLRWAFTQAERLTCRSARRVICLTHADADAARRNGVSTNRLVVIPNGIDPLRFSVHDDRRQELGISQDAPVAGFIARLVPQKDPVLFVEVCAEVARALPQARFLLVGDGPLRASVEAAAQEAGLTDRLLLTGFRPDVPQLLAAIDVFVLTSAWEGLPFAVLEAMASRRPVVAPDLPGIDEVIENGRTGLIVGTRQPRQLAQAVERLLRMPEVCRQMGAAARDRLERHFTVTAMAAATAEVYSELQ